MPELYKSILNKPGSENMGGWQNRILFYPAHWMKEIPTLIKDAQTIEELALADGAFEFIDPANKPIAIYATPRTVGMKADNQGETDGQSFHITGEFFHPNVKTEVGGFSRLVNNTPGYMVVFSPEGDQFIIGQIGLPVTIKPSFDGGTAPADRRGTAYSFENDSYAPYIKLKTPIADADLAEYFKAA